MWLFWRKGRSGFSGSSTAEEVTHGIDGSPLTCIVTGASSGLGAETTRVLALRGVHVVMGVRNIEAAREIKDKIVEEIPEAKLDIMELDLSSLASVRTFASDYKASKHPLNILINNAGVMGTPFMLSHDNIELQFATNHLGHFLLAHLLLETMKQTAQESGREGRIINVSSEGHRRPYSEGICFDKFNDPKGYRSLRAYGQSKLANILHAHQLTKHLKDDGANITANSLHPGLIDTNLFRYNRWMEVLISRFGKYTFKTIPQGAATTCYMALHPNLNGISGEYFSNCNLAKPSSRARDATLAQKLWDFSMSLVK